MFIAIRPAGGLLIRLFEGDFSGLELFNESINSIDIDIGGEVSPGLVELPDIDVAVVSIFKMKRDLDSPDGFGVDSHIDICVIFNPAVSLYF